MTDFLTIYWKEIKDVVLSGGRSSLLRPLVLVAVFGVMLPLQLGSDLWDLPAVLLFPEVWGPVFVGLTIISDAFAGERERHTLESLLATPVSDGALVMGKMAVGVSYGMAVMVVDLLIGIVLADQSAGTFAFYPLGLFVAVLVLGLAVNTLGAAAGVLVSMRVSTVRQAQQVVTIGAMVVLVGGLTLFSSLASHIHWSIGYTEALWLLAIAVAAVDAAIVLITLTAYRRTRLILA